MKQVPCHITMQAQIIT